MGWTDLIQVSFALLAVLGLIGLCAIGARKAGLLTAAGGFSNKRRLALIETLPLDARRRIAIIKCDNTEHLIVLGANGETIIQNDLPTQIETPPLTVARVKNETPEPQRQNPFAILTALKKHADRKTVARMGDLTRDANAA